MIDAASEFTSERCNLGGVVAHRAPPCAVVVFAHHLPDARAHLRDEHRRRRVRRTEVHARDDPPPFLPAHERRDGHVLIDQARRADPLTLQCPRSVVPAKLPPHRLDHSRRDGWVVLDLRSRVNRAQFGGGGNHLGDGMIWTARIAGDEEARILRVKARLHDGDGLWAEAGCIVDQGELEARTEHSLKVGGSGHADQVEFRASDVADCATLAQLERHVPQGGGGAEVRDNVPP